MRCPSLAVRVLCLGAGLLAGSAAAENSAVCPDLEQHSLSVCDRCVSDDLCPITGGVTYVCDAFHKLCVHPDWTANASEIPSRCGVVESRPETWGAQCMLACNDQRSPFSCATSYCANEEFPCKWVPGCNPPHAVSQYSSACMRSCMDHEDLLQFRFSGHTCESASLAHGCARMGNYCPVTCATPECPTRCNRDEVAVDGDRCWSIVEDGVDCITAIKRGYDCNCKCAHIYLMVGGRYQNNRGGPFKLSDRVSGQSLRLEYNVTAGSQFSLPLPGQSMWTGDLTDHMGARMKIVDDGATCSTAAPSAALEGIQCERPAGADLFSVMTCSTGPALATDKFQRWDGLTLNACGEFDVCHCNGQCDVRENWQRAGVIHVRPQTTQGAVSAIPEGCEAYMVTPTPDPDTGVVPVGPATGRVEKAVEEVIRFAFSIEGGLPPFQTVLDTIKSTLQAALATPSQLLGTTVPELDDIELEHVVRRRLRAAAPPRQAQGVCQDDPAAWVSESTRLSIPQFESCQLLLAQLQDRDMMCNDATMAPAIDAGCQRTCELCDGPEPTQEPAPGDGTTQAPASSATTSTAGRTTSAWPGGPEALRLRVAVHIRTDVTSEQIMAKFTALANDPTAYLQGLYTALSDAGVRAEDIPDSMIMHVVEQPRRELPPEPVVAEEEQAISTSLTIIIAVCGALGGSLCLACGIAIVWYLMTHDYSTKVDAVDEGPEFSMSENGYRIKRNPKKPQQAQEEQEELEGCCCPRLEACCMTMVYRCWSRCCERRRLIRVDPAMMAAGRGEGVYIGATVQLCGLSQAHYNGLIGTVVAGPNEKGRYDVDLNVVDTDHFLERQTLSFRPENMRVFAAQAAAAQQPQQQQNNFVGNAVQVGYGQGAAAASPGVQAGSFRAQAAPGIGGSFRAQMAQGGR